MTSGCAAGAGPGKRYCSRGGPCGLCPWCIPRIPAQMCRQSRSPWRAFPLPLLPLGQTPAYCCAPSSRGSRGASTACARCLSHSANTQPNPGPAAHPLAFPVGGKGERAGQPQHPAGTLDPPAGVPQLRFNSWQGKKEAAAQEDSRGSSRLGNRVGWSVNIRGGERGARWTEWGGQSPQKRGTQGANARPPRQQGCVRERRGPG